MDDPNELLTTTAVADILACSRQHVVNLCTSKRLNYIKVGTHRRIMRRDVFAFLGQKASEKQLTMLPAHLGRDDLLSLWLHRAVAGRLAFDPTGTIALAEKNLAILHERYPRAARWLDQWAVFISDPELVLEILTSLSKEAVALRQNTPFGGALSQGERETIIRSFETWWESRTE